jgi:hypothetical protein
MKPIGKKPCAFHEAGHVVIARTLGGHVTSVNLRLKPYVHGYTNFWCWDEPTDDAIIALAGPAAENIYRPLSDRAFYHAWENGWGRDIKAAGHAVGFGKAFEDADDRAHALVIEHWECITRVAEALLKHKRLNAQQLDMLIEG